MGERYVWRQRIELDERHKIREETYHIRRRRLGLIIPVYDHRPQKLNECIHISVRQSEIDAAFFDQERVQPLRRLIILLIRIIPVRFSLHGFHQRAGCREKSVHIPFNGVCVHVGKSLPEHHIHQPRKDVLICVLQSDRVSVIRFDLVRVHRGV